MAVALVTGSSSGIGKLSALELARRGHRVFASMRNLDSARYILAAADREHLSVEIIRLDVTDQRSVTSAIDNIIGREGRLDILVNNAGFGTFGAVEDYTDDDIRHVFETNLFGVIRTTRAALLAMRTQRSGTIVMMSSISGLRTFPFASVYSASKFALEAISNGLRYELRPFGIRVVLVEPGNFNTRAGANMHRPERVRLGASGSCDPMYPRMVESYFRARGQLELGDPVEVAKVVADASEAERPAARYLIGKDAERFMSLPADEFQQMFSDMLTRV